MAFANKLQASQVKVALTEWLSDRLDDVEVSAIEVPATSGLSCETVLFDASWQQSAARRTESLVARVAPQPGTGLFPEYDLEREALVMRALSEHTGVPTPRILFTESDESVLGGHFIVMNRIRGRVPSDDPPYSVSGWVLDLSLEQQRALLDNAVDTVAAVARIDVGSLGLEALGRLGLDAQIAYLQHLYEDGAHGRAHAVPEAGLAWLRENAPTEEPLRLCWGDARIGNMMFADDLTVSGALDWEIASLGSPEADLGYFLLALRLWSEGFGAPSPPGFPDRAEIVARFEAASGHVCHHLDYYERYGAVFAAIMVMRGGYHMIDAGILPADSTMPQTNPGSVLLADLLDVPAPTGAVTDWAGKR
jgi:aminoglycoside phosphotransferase (APT) family kinase protein